MPLKWRSSPPRARKSSNSSKTSLPHLLKSPRPTYEEQLRVLKSALAERQSQLDSVQCFVTMADKYADTMIIQMLQKLNAEVQQYTEFMADWVLRDFGPQAMKLMKEQSSVVQRVSESIGKTLTGCLDSEKHNNVALHISSNRVPSLSYVLPMYTLSFPCGPSRKITTGLSTRYMNNCGNQVINWISNNINFSATVQLLIMHTARTAKLLCIMRFMQNKNSHTL